MAEAYGISGDGEPLLFFYDCETTGLRVGYDVIIEIAAVLHTKDLQYRVRGAQEFVSLCNTKRELSPMAEHLTGLTKHALRNEPKLEEVLHRFFDWMKETVETASRMQRRDYVPVLAAHGGTLLDFPMLFTAMRRLGARDLSLQRKFDGLNLHYANTLGAIRQLAKTGTYKLDKLGLKDAYEVFFGYPLDGHRALGDAEALHRIFTEAVPADELMTFLRQHIQSKEGIDITRQQIQHFRNANLKAPKVIELLQRKITYEDFKTEFRKSENNFARFLMEKCGISNPERELWDHFRALRLH